MEKAMLEKMKKYRWVSEKDYERTAEVWDAYLKNANASYASRITPNVVGKMLDHYDDEMAKDHYSPGRLQEIAMAWSRIVGFEVSEDDFEMMIVMHDRVQKALADDILSGKITFKASKR